MMHIIAIYMMNAKLGDSPLVKAMYIIGRARRYVEPIPILRNFIRPVA